MRLNVSQCSALKENATSRVLRSTKTLAGIQRQQFSLSDISNSQCQLKQKEKEYSDEARESMRKDFPARKKNDSGDLVGSQAPVKARRSKAVCKPLPCTTIGRKRVVGVDDDCGFGAQSPECITPTHSSRSSEVYWSSPEFETSPRKKLASPSPPSTPTSDSSYSECSEVDETMADSCGSPLERLPFDLLVRIVCCLQHDELKPVLQVSETLQNAVQTARQFHFNFTTPGRSKKGTLGPLNFRPAESLQCGHENVFSLNCPSTPNAPRHAPNCTQRKVTDADMRPFAPPLFQEPAVLPHSGHFFRKSRPASRNVPSHRVLFYEDELCQAVAQNSI